MINQLPPPISDNMDACQASQIENTALPPISAGPFIAFLDAEGHFVNVCSTTDHFLGYCAGQLKGQSILNYISREHHSRVQMMMEEVADGCSIKNFKVCFLDRNKNKVNLSLSMERDATSGMVVHIDHQENISKEKITDAGIHRAYRLVNLGWWELDLQSDKLLWSDELYRILGLDRHKVEGSKELFMSMVHPEDREFVTFNLSEGEHSQYYNFEHRMIQPDGTHIYVLHEVEAIRDREGKLIMIGGATKNVTTRKMVQLSLQAAKKRIAGNAELLGEILESLGDGFYAVDRNWTVTYWNSKAECMSGIKKEEILNKNIWSEYGQALPQKLYKEYSRALTDKVSVCFEEYIERDKKWYDISAYPSKIGLSIFFRDITEQKKINEEVKMLSQVVEAAQHIVMITDNEHRIQWVNQAFTRITEYTIEEAIGKKPGELLHGLQTSPSIKEYLHDCVVKLIPFKCELINYTKSGKQFWLEIKGGPILNENGEAKQFFALLTDITERRLIEEQVRESERRYKFLFNSSPIPKWIFKAESNRFVEVNEAAIQHLGYSREEFLNMTIYDLHLEEDRPMLDKVVACRPRRGSKRYHSIVRHKTKDNRIVFSEVSSILIEIGSEAHYIVEINDVTEKLQLQEQVLKEKIARQKEIAKAIMDTQEKERSEVGKELHDNVNQILTTAKLCVENIRYYPQQQNSFIDKSVCLLQNAINEIRVLCRMLITPVFNDMGFETAARELIEQFNLLDRFSINHFWQFDETGIEKELKVTIYRILQEQLNNIVKYARASNVSVSLVQEDQQLLLSIKDNGEGFDMNHCKKGLGLANIKNRAEIYKGKVAIDTAPGKGCKIEVVFPVGKKVLYG